MAMVVVDELEVVEIDQQAGERAARARRANDLLVQAAAHGAVVHAARNGIGPGLGARTPERKRCGGLIDERARKLDGALIEVPAVPADEDLHPRQLGPFPKRPETRAAG